MKRQSARFLCATAALVLGATAWSGTANAQDHLKCYKIKDIGQFKSATATLTPSQMQFVTENCSLKGKGAQLCVPASKNNVVIEGGATQFSPSEALTDDAQICYKIKCPNAAVVSLQVSDQFGTRFIAKGKATKVCGPAVEQ